MDGAEISIDFDIRLAFAGISADFDNRFVFAGITSGGGVTLTDISFDPITGTADFKASFAALAGTDPPLTLATIKFNTFAPFRQEGDNLLLVSTSDRKTVGRFEGRDVPAVLRDARLEVNTPPAAVAVGPTVVVLAGQVAAFDGTASVDQDGTIVSFTWSFGDGGVGVGSVTSHTYNQVGVFPVALTVTDNDGARRTATLTITVESGAQNFPPNAIAGASGPKSAGPM